MRAPGLGAQPHDGVARSQLADLQRARIISAMFDVATELGAANASVTPVVERAGVSRRTFYELFSDREDCLLAAFEQALSYVSDRVIVRYEGETGWREQIRSGLIALLGFLDEEPVIARFLFVESHACGRAMGKRRAQILNALAGVIERGRTQPKALTPPPLTGEGLVGGVLSVVQSRLLDDDGESLLGLADPLLSMIVLPYLGATAARRELERLTPQAARAEPREPRLTDPFKDTGLRLTYRTARVLVAIADQPGGSNRLVADTAETKDEGQISKLLSRLQRAGFITNTSAQAGKGMPNAWTLTSQGQQFVATIRSHTEVPRPGSHA